MMESERCFSVLFLSPKWQCDAYGIATLNMSLITDLRKIDPRGDAIKLTCAVLEIEDAISCIDIKDAERYAVKLVGARTPYGSKENPELTWLDVYSGSYFRHVMHSTRFDFIVGHVPYLGNGSLNMRKIAQEQGHSPKIALVLHSLPKTENGDIDENTLQTWIESSVLILSVGSGIKLEIDEYISLFGIDDSDIPHILYTPNCPFDLFKIERPSRPEPVKGPQIISVITGEAKDLRVKGLNYDLAVSAAAKATHAILEQSSLLNKVKITLYTVGSMEEEKEQWEKHFDFILDRVSKDDKRLGFSYRDLQNEKELRNILTKTSLCILPLKPDSTLYGIEALLAAYAGVPVLVARNAGIADHLYRIHATNSIMDVKGSVTDTEKWKYGITRKVLNAVESEQEACEIRNYLLTDTGIEASHWSFINAIIGM